MLDLEMVENVGQALNTARKEGLQIANAIIYVIMTKAIFVVEITEVAYGTSKNIMEMRQINPFVKLRYITPKTVHKRAAITQEISV